MERLLGRYGIIPFQDDIAIASATAEEHKQKVLEILKVLTYEAGLRLRLKKCKFFVKEARVLGSIITGNGIKMDPQKIKAITNWSLPTDGKALQRFLGAANFHRDFSHEYAKIAAPLEEIQNAKGIIEWSQDRIAAFNGIKQLFANQLQLQTIDWRKTMYLTTDASLTAIGAWIGQVNSVGKVIPVICISKKLGSTQQRWSATKRELYALMWAMQKLHHYLLGRQFIARVDHKPLVEMLKNRVTPMMEGWVDIILQFEFVTQYMPGHTNSLADALSRSYETSVKKSTIKDPKLQISKSNSDRFEFEAKKRGKSIPKESERISLLEQAHVLGHFSIDSVVKQLWKDGFWWPGIQDDARKTVNKCIDCQRFNIQKEGFHPIKSIEANHPWDHIQIDLIGPLPTSSNGFSWILTTVDVMTGFSLLRAMHHKTMEEVAIHLWQMICEYGTPKIIQSDNGAEFVNGVIKELSTLFGIDHCLITPYNPRADGLVERKNKEVGRDLKKRMKGAPDKRELVLPTVQLGLNLKTLKRTGSTPFELFYARPFNGFANWQNSKETNLEQSILNRLQDLNKLQTVVLPAISERTAQVRTKRNQNFNATNKILEPIHPGTQVMVKDSTRESKWDPVYEGPFIINRQNRGGSYVLNDANGQELPLCFTVDKLKILDVILPSGGRTKSTAEPQDINVSQTGNKNQHYEILGILKHCQNKQNKGYEYLVRWKGYKSEDDSWVPEQDFGGLATIRKYWKQHANDKIELPKDQKSKPKKSKLKKST